MTLPMYIIYLLRLGTKLARGLTICSGGCGGSPRLTWAMLLLVLTLSLGFSFLLRLSSSSIISTCLGVWGHSPRLIATRTDTLVGCGVPGPATNVVPSMVPSQVPGRGMENMPQ